MGDPSWKDALLAKGEADCRFSPYCWNAIDCGDGWRPLVEAFYALVDRSPCMSVAQVKEKYGTLRLYWSHDAEQCSHEKWSSADGEMQINADDHWHQLIGLISGLEYASGFMCEACGSYGTVRNHGGWVQTLCDKCEEKRP